MNSSSASFDFPIRLTLVCEPAFAGNARGARASLEATVPTDARPVEIELIGLDDPRAPFAEGVWQRPDQPIGLPDATATLYPRPDRLTLAGEEARVVRDAAFDAWIEQWARAGKFREAAANPRRADPQAIAKSMDDLLPDALMQDAPAELRVLRRRFAVADTIANSYSDVWRSLVLRTLRLSLAASLALVAYHSFFFESFHAPGMTALRFTSAGLFLLLVLAAYFTFKWWPPGRPHRRYIESRVLAEALRVLFFLRLGGSDQNVGALLAKRRVHSLDWISRIVGRDSAALPAAPATAQSTVTTIHAWCQKQREYFRHAAPRARAEYERAKRLKNFYLWCIPLVAVIKVAGSGFFKPMVFDQIQSDWVRLLLCVAIYAVFILPFFGAYFMAKVSLLALRETADRYAELEIVFTEAMRRLHEAQHRPHEVAALQTLLAEEAINELAAWAQTQSARALEVTT